MTAATQDTITATSSTSAGDDPHIWLEQVLDEKALEWVTKVNADCISAIGDPKSTPAYTRIKAILDSHDKIPHAYQIGTLGYYNFWQDETHVQGIWRKTTLESFQTKTSSTSDASSSNSTSYDTQWTTVLDLDALAPPNFGDTAATWVWSGSILLKEGHAEEAHDRAMIKLSPGGSDAIVVREFDLRSNTFLDENNSDDTNNIGAFSLTQQPAKTNIAYRSRNECLVGTDFNFDKSTLTDSGYPRVVKSWKRGTPIDDAVTVFTCQQTDIAAHQYAYHDRGWVHEFQLRSMTFYTSEYHYRPLTHDQLVHTTADLESTPFVKVPIPEDATLGTFADMALVSLRSDFTPPGGTNNATYRKGSLLTLPMDDLMQNDWTEAVPLFVPTPTRSLSDTTETKDYIILKLLDNVCTVLEFYKFNKEDHSWTKQPQVEEDHPAVPVGLDVAVHSHSRHPETDNLVWLWKDGFLLPDTLQMASAENACATPTPIRSKPAMFDANGLRVEQHFATSRDGTQIPYFCIRRDHGPLDGSTPTLLDAYGGFEVSNLPGYFAGVGAGWLERGGCKVIANIRGGGEYGPSWHQAALKGQRHKCFEDVEAVAQDLIHRKITSPSKLACIGGSNGGLLVGNLITRPIASQLFGAAVCQVPLLDMKRYSHLLAGASWVGEYGDPGKPQEWKALRRNSPYHRLRHDILGQPEANNPLVDDNDNGNAYDGDPSTWKCPQTLFTTSTRDDRVHPGHARKMVAALLEEAGRDKAPTVYYWENTEGGHGGAADNSQRAYMWALTYNFLAQALGLDQSSSG